MSYTAQRKFMGKRKTLTTVSRSLFPSSINNKNISAQEELNENAFWKVFSFLNQMSLYMEEGRRWNEGKEKKFLIIMWKFLFMLLQTFH